MESDTFWIRLRIKATFDVPYLFVCYASSWSGLFCKVDSSLIVIECHFSQKGRYGKYILIWNEQDEWAFHRLMSFDCALIFSRHLLFACLVDQAQTGEVVHPRQSFLCGSIRSFILLLIHEWEAGNVMNCGMVPFFWGICMHICNHYFIPSSFGRNNSNSGEGLAYILASAWRSDLEYIWRAGVFFSGFIPV